jgi:hypothetical protein
MSHAPTEDECDNTRNSFYEELEHAFRQFPKYRMKNFVSSFQCKGGEGRYFQIDN